MDWMYLEIHSPSVREMRRAGWALPDGRPVPSCKAMGWGRPASMVASASGQAHEVRMGHVLPGPAGRLGMGWIKGRGLTP